MVQNGSPRLFSPAGPCWVPVGAQVPRAILTCQSPNFQAASAFNRVLFRPTVVVPNGPGRLPVSSSTKGCTIMNCVVAPRKFQPGLKINTSAFTKTFNFGALPAVAMKGAPGPTLSFC